MIWFSYLILFWEPLSLGNNSQALTADGTTTTQAIEMSYNDMEQPTTMIYPDGEALTAQYDVNGYYRSSDVLI